MLFTAAFAAAVASAAASDPQHPTLPTMWVATTNEPEVGVGVEAYKFVDRPTPENPSGMWSNYSDNNCYRLILDGNNINDYRYELGCYAVDCCIEEQEGNQIEFQIPNVHLPGNKSVPVKYGGKQTVSSFGESIECDMWSWSFLGQSWDVFTTEDDTAVNNVVLHLWSTSVEGETFNITFKDFHGITPEEEDAFVATFREPDVCQGAMSCGMDDEHAPLEIADSIPVETPKDPQHPTLPTMWIATTDEPGQGIGVEGYNFVERPTPDNPSGIWSNYSDEGCYRLILDGDNIDDYRYELGCYAVDCCIEEQEGNQVEFQIPNVHLPGNKSVPVKYGGKETIRKPFPPDYDEVECDVWSWAFGEEESWHALTTECDECYMGVELHLWSVTAVGEQFNITFKDYHGIDPNSQEGADFRATFREPDVCQDAIACPEDD